MNDFGGFRDFEIFFKEFNYGSIDININNTNRTRIF